MRRLVIPAGLLVLLSLIAVWGLNYFRPTDDTNRDEISAGVAARHDDQGDSVKPASKDKPPVEKTPDRPKEPGPTANPPTNGREEPKPNPPPQEPRDPAKLPLGAPEKVRIPKLSARGVDDQFRAMIDIPVAKKRFVGMSPDYPRKPDYPTRVVHGHVYEVRGANRFPLEGVMVHDGNYRTFTDEKGRFEFEARYRSSESDSAAEEPPHPERPWKGSKYTVELGAFAAGYDWIDAGEDDRTRGFYSTQLETDEGAVLLLKALQNESIEVTIKNPELASEPPLVVLASIPPGGLIDDERMVIATTASHDGKAWFSVPPNRFGLEGVTGKGVEMSWTGRIRPRAAEGGKLWEVSLITCDNFLTAGTVNDFRTGRPIDKALVRGLGQNEIGFSDADGRFSLWLSTKPQNSSGKITSSYNSFSIRAFGYATIYADTESLNQRRPSWAGTAVVGPGGSRAGPWFISLRPWVRATGRVHLPNYVTQTGDHIAFLESSVDFKAGWPDRATLNADGTFSFERVPWGVASFYLNLQNEGPRRVHKKVEIAEECWRGDGPYDLTVTVKD